jgi:hypothetical protein
MCIAIQVVGIRLVQKVETPGESGLDDIRKFVEFIEFRLEVTMICNFH